MQRDFSLSETQAREYRVRLEKRCIVLSLDTPPRLVPYDPDDDKVLWCALQAEATLVITYDQDLLRLDPFRGVRIMTPETVFRNH